MGKGRAGEYRIAYEVLKKSVVALEDFLSGDPKL